MSWKEKLSEFESSFGRHEKRNWMPAVELVENLISEYPDDVEVNIRAIYLIHNILVEEEYLNDEHDLMADMLKRYFDSSYQRFSENPEYLFFIGKILYISEWYFGLDDDIGPLEEKLSFKMQKKAFHIEPNNELYEWAYMFSKDEKKKAFTLSKQILHGKSDSLNWLITKGFPGKYLIESLEYCYENYNH